jgi:hypothetical protein
LNLVCHGCFTTFLRLGFNIFFAELITRKPLETYGIKATKNEKLFVKEGRKVFHGDGVQSFSDKTKVRLTAQSLFLYSVLQFSERVIEFRFPAVRGPSTSMIPIATMSLSSSSFTRTKLLVGSPTKFSRYLSIIYDAANLS